MIILLPGKATIGGSVNLTAVLVWLEMEHRFETQN
jgi:hypothetical protein